MLRNIWADVFQPFIILDFLNIVDLLHILGPPACFNNSAVSDARLFSSALTQVDCWEQGAVSSSWTCVSEAALWENSQTLDYAWRQVTCQVFHNEAETKLPFTSLVRPLFRLFFFFLVRRGVNVKRWNPKQIHIPGKRTGTLDKNVINFIFYTILNIVIKYRQGKMFGFFCLETAL